MMVSLPNWFDGTNCTPGSRATIAKKFRFGAESSTISLVPLFPPTSVLVTSIIGDTSVLVTLSANAPTASAKLIVSVLPDSGIRQHQEKFLQPASVAGNVYRRG